MIVCCLQCGVWQLGRGRAWETIQEVGAVFQVGIAEGLRERLEAGGLQDIRNPPGHHLPHITPSTLVMVLM